MNKRVKYFWIFLLIIFFVIVLTTFLVSPRILGKFIAKATQELLGIRITLTEGIAPTVIIYSPRNITYNYNTSISLSYYAYDESGIEEWYTLNSGPRINLSGDTTFNISEGSHNLTVFANDSYGNLNFSSIIFYVNLSRIVGVYEKFKGINKGNSTNFESLSNEELQNLTGMTLEDTRYGLIVFSQLVDMLNDKNASDNTTDLDSNVFISNSSIYINTTALPNLKKAATLWLYDLPFTNPRILRDGEVCSFARCQNISYSTGILRFDVTEFSNYSVEETPPVQPGPTPSTGGGGGIKKETQNFAVEPDIIKIHLTPGETTEKSVNITNTGDTKLNIGITFKDLDRFLILRQDSFELEKNTTKDIEFIFIAKSDQEPNIYTGEIIFRADTIIRTIEVVIEIESKKALFDVDINLPRQFQAVYPGEEIIGEISLYNLGLLKRADVVVDYGIKDIHNNIITTKQKTLAVETQASLFGNLDVPSDLEPGDYLFYVRVTYDDTVALSTATFKVIGEEVVKVKREYNTAIIIAIVVIIILFAIIVYYEYKKLKEINKYLKRINEDDLFKAAMIKIK